MAQREGGPVGSPAADRATVVAVAGLGLIGGSVLRDFHAAGYPVIGYDADETTRALASDAGFTIAENLDELAGADILVSAVPWPALPDLLTGLDGFEGLLTDVTSIKAPVARLLASQAPRLRFVGGHPMAGKETSGFAAGQTGLFTDRSWVLCLDEATDLDDWLALAWHLSNLSVRIVPTSPARHDSVVAEISHLPHLLAAALARAAAEPLAARLAAGSFTDGTRVAASRPELVAAMCGGNASALRPVLRELLSTLDQADAALAGADPVAALTGWLTPGHLAAVNRGSTVSSSHTMAVSQENLLSLGEQGGWISSVDRDTRTVMTVRSVMDMP